MIGFTALLPRGVSPEQVEGITIPFEDWRDLLEAFAILLAQAAGKIEQGEYEEAKMAMLDACLAEGFVLERAGRL